MWNWAHVLLKIYPCVPLLFAASAKAPKQHISFKRDITLFLVWNIWTDQRYILVATCSFKLKCPTSAALEAMIISQRTKSFYGRFRCVTLLLVFEFRDISYTAVTFPTDGKARHVVSIGPLAHDHLIWPLHHLVGPDWPPKFKDWF